MRLDKYLADAGVGTRKEVKEWIKRGLVTVNGVAVKDPGTHVAAEDEVLYDGDPVANEEFVYLMLHKPPGVVSATEDAREKTVLDLIEAPHPKGLFPVGRLDKDTVGLLLLTNDGALAHRLLSPKKHVEKTYFARVSGEVTAADVEAFSAGIELSDFICLPAELVIVERDTALVTLREGKFHQIKRMFHACGKEVLYLKRLSMGPLTLDPALPEGSYRPLTADERVELLGYHSVIAAEP